MAGIFVSYQQADAKASAISLRDDLAEAFGTDQVFLDKDTLRAGNWRKQIEDALDRCKVVLVVIGPRWLTIADEQNRPCISLAEDMHHQEIVLALSQSDLTIIPVLVDEAPMPRAEQLPHDLHKLCEHQPRKIGDTQARRKADLEVLIEDIESVTGIERRARPNAQDQPKPPTPERTAWLKIKIEITTLVSASVLTVFAGMYFYLSNLPLGFDELFFLLLAFWLLVLGVRWLRRRVVGARKGRT